jgi:hypothetical protein
VIKILFVIALDLTFLHMLNCKLDSNQKVGKLLVDGTVGRRRLSIESSCALQFGYLAFASGVELSWTWRVF